jgi:uncharacterized membrane protein (DUF441 family)
MARTVAVAGMIADVAVVVTDTAAAAEREEMAIVIVVAVMIAVLGETGVGYYKN